MPDHPRDDRTYIRDDGRIVLTGVVLYRCPACQKDHVTGLWTSTRPTHCPCGEPFPPGEFFQWRTAPTYYRDSPPYSTIFSWQPHEHASPRTPFQQ